MGAALHLETLACILQGPKMDMGVLVVGDRSSVGFPLVIKEKNTFSFCEFVIVFPLD
jgi:hypothetical protein